MTMEGSEALPFDWETLVPLVVHPLKVAIVEALLWIEEPLSASELTKTFSQSDMSLSRISYHVRMLAEVGVLTKVRERPVRGSVEKFYFFP
jgi:DNA-binding transcriptional regulator GbsR (MarR family)